MPGSPTGTNLALLASNMKSGNGGVHNSSRGWTRIPKIDMGRRTRMTVEGLIRKHTIWNPYDVTLSNSQKQLIINDLKPLGFRLAHVEEAVENCKDREETLPVKTYCSARSIVLSGTSF